MKKDSTCNLLILHWFLITTPPPANGNKWAIDLFILSSEGFKPGDFLLRNVHTVLFI